MKRGAWSRREQRPIRIIVEMREDGWALLACGHWQAPHARSYRGNYGTIKRYCDHCPLNLPVEKAS